MKARFYVTFEAETARDSAGALVVKRVKPVSMRQTSVAAGRGVPIEFVVDLPEELFLSRIYRVNVDLPAPSGPTPTVTAVPGSAWDAALKKAGA